MFSKARRRQKHHQSRECRLTAGPQSLALPPPLFSYAKRARSFHAALRSHSTSLTAHFGPQKTPTGSCEVKGLPCISTNFLEPPLCASYRDWENRRLQFPEQTAGCWGGCTAWGPTLTAQPVCRRTQALACTQKRLGLFLWRERQASILSSPGWQAEIHPGADSLSSQLCFQAWGRQIGFSQRIEAGQQL